MYCNVCGGVLTADQAVCGKCGSPVIGNMTVTRLAHHVSLSGILWIAYCVLEALGGCALVMVAHFVFPPYSDHPAFLHPLLTGLGIFLLAKAALALILGFALLERQPWARTLSLFLAILALLNVPIGTALGIYTLWVFMSPQSERAFAR